MSVERYAHTFSMMMPSLTGLELPIDYNVPGRQIMGHYDPIKEPYQYFARFLLTIIQQNKFRLHGGMLYVEHVLPDPRVPSGFVSTRFWKPYMELTQYAYESVMPVYHEHVFRAYFAIRDNGVKSVIDQIQKSTFVPKIKPDFRYRSFRNGLY